MTDKQKLDAIKAEIHRLVDVRGYDREMANDLLAFMNSLPNEPVSEDFEVEVKNLWKEINTGHNYSIVDSYNMFYGLCMDIAEWQKEQFEKERLKHCDGLTDEQAQIESDFVAQHLKDNNRTPTFIDAIEYGMKMQKEQMMAKGVDGVVHHFEKCGVASVHYKDPTGVPMSYFMSPKGIFAGDKVKIIVIKED